MAATQHRRDAACARQSNLQGVGLDRIGGLSVVGIGKPGADLLPERAVALLPRSNLEIGASHIVLHWLEAIGAQFLKSVREIVDRIVRPRSATVTAWIVGREEVGLKGLLGHRDAATERAEILVVRRATAIGVEAEFGIGKIAPLCRAERRSDTASLLVAAVEENDVAV